ncbi:helix-turn-helix domain-containing protein [Streptococcus thermophilus]|uniref:helix-turn-helix domain-containing protein n=1 Tax=Streptococcus thermophilus TaxID=1308 RepID=UPI001593917D|nr:helix-turn-helix domain-containing protein [Streptococcus thermophilus]MCD9220813.1 helix-turn-helix domain-containing protein [Streptococcus thermophilus]MCE2115258.1 helix-turn-helix domain-containing protein [Streptococcus thermophilus]MCE2126610.1 helix-turn-helix domain-containing protein [Streptococcus thermophilus]MCE2156172.1 helix-turn-helix domain-containing protein [Streptococcus thermophilus]MCE2171030.1 helix-turn-helix domain-containing protein [Streptococcus thermophilus]
MGFSYERLWELTLKRRINKTSLRDMVGITNSTLSRLSKDETVSMEALARLCEALQCQLEEIIEYKLENKDRVE